MIILYGVAVTSTRCRFGFGYRNRKFPRKETGVYTQGNDSVYVRKQQFPCVYDIIPRRFKIAKDIYAL